MYDTYVVEVFCDNCKETHQYSVEDRSGDNLMRVFNTGDLVPEHKAEWKTIEHEVECYSCDTSIKFNIPLFYGVVLPVGKNQFVTNDEKLAVIRNAAVSATRRFREEQHMTSVVKLILRLWLSLGASLPPKMKIEDPGLPTVSRGMSADQVLLSIAKYFSVVPDPGDCNNGE